MKENIWTIVGALGIAAIAILLFVGEYGESPADTRFPEPTSSFSETRAENIRLVNARKIADGAYPNFSPDGRWISFGYQGGLAVMSTDKMGTPKKVGSVYALSYSAVWTPDSRELFYLERSPIKAPPYFKSLIQSVDIKRGRVKSYPQITLNLVSELDSLIKARIPSDPVMYLVSGSSGEIIRARTKDRSRDWLVTPEKGQYFNLKLSPDKRKLLVENGGDIVIYFTDGNGLVSNLGEGGSPSWSPDGKVILYDKGESDGYITLASDLYAINTDGTGIKQLTFSPDVFESGPVWSPDGKKVLFWDFKTAAIYTADVVTE